MNRLTAALFAVAEAGKAPDGPASGPFRSVCVLVGPLDAHAVSEAWSGWSLPAEVAELWRTTGGARLFEDTEYGQWGLVLLSAEASRHRTEAELKTRPADVAHGDIVIGEFLGDQELLVYSSDSGVLVALPLDDRLDWFQVAPTLAEFLERYTAAQGAKYWEHR